MDVFFPSAGTSDGRSIVFGSLAFEVRDNSIAVELTVSRGPGPDGSNQNEKIEEVVLVGDITQRLQQQGLTPTCVNAITKENELARNGSFLAYLHDTLSYRWVQIVLDELYQAVKKCWGAETSTKAKGTGFERRSHSDFVQKQQISPACGRR